MTRGESAFARLERALCSRTLMRQPAFFRTGVTWQRRACRGIADRGTSTPEEQIRVRTAHVAGASSSKQFPRLGLPEVALAGRSNVGKSALLNRLVGRRALARVSKTPGRTQQIHFFVVDDKWVLVDLPGYGFARVPLAIQQQWRPLVEAYLLGRRALRGVVLLIDVRRGIADDDELLLDTLRRHAVPVAVAVTKIDKLAWGQRQRQLAAIRAGHPDVGVIACSAVTGEGTQGVLAQLREWVQGGRVHGGSVRQ